MPEAFLVEATRTPVGRRGGGLSDVHPVDLAAAPIRALIDRVGLDPGDVDDVIYGCIDNIGPQSANIARTAWLSAGFPEHVPGVTIDRRCGSSQQAVHFAASSVTAGHADLVIAGGTQHMSSIPIGASYAAGRDHGYEDPVAGSRGWAHRYNEPLFGQLQAADLIAERWSISRNEMERYAFSSHQRALTAQAEGRFRNEIADVAGLARDECPRTPNLEKMQSLAPNIQDGRNTPATSSPISDGAAALLVASERAVEDHGLEPKARIHHISVRGDDPRLMLTAPISATRRALERTGMELADFDVIEVNEAFASVVLAWIREFTPDEDRLNPNGGAIALGHPIGATGARIMTSLLHELDRVHGRFGLQTMCEGGGQANVTIVERA